MPDDEPVSNGRNGRDSRGRFTPGGPPGPGNPGIRKLAEAQAAVREAIGPDDLKAVLVRLRDRALGGDVAAARVLLERVLGRAPAQGVTVELDVPEIRNATDSARATLAVLDAAVRGRIALESASKLLALVQGVTDAVVIEDLERRLTTMEERRE